MRKAMMLAIFAPSAVHAATWEVGPSRPLRTIQAAIDAAASGDAILVDAGTYRERLQVSKDLTITGAGASATRLSTGGNGTLVSVSGAQLELGGLTLDDAERAIDVSGGCLVGHDLDIRAMDVDGDGAGVRARNGAVVTLDRVRFSDTKANGGRGGAIYLENADLQGSNIEVDQGDADDGGGLYLAGGSQAALADSVFRDSQVDQRGGAFFVEGGAELGLVRVDVVQNQSQDEGGGLFVSGNGSNVVTLESVRFEGNRADQGGPAVWMSGGRLTSDATFVTGHRGRAAVALRGGAAWDGAGDTFSNNQSNGSGGAVSVRDSASMQLADGAFNQNSAQDGGAVAHGGSGTLSLTGVELASNRAARAGGAIWWRPGVSSATLTLTDVRAERNEATDGGSTGGAVYAEGGGLVMVGSDLAYNRASEGGALFLRALSTAQISRNVLCANTAVAGRGGGASAQDIGAASWRNNVFAENAASSFGGGAFHVGGGSALMVNNTFVYNRATQSGGAAYFSGLRPSFQNNLVAWTTAGSGLASDAAAAIGFSPAYGGWWLNAPAHLGGSLNGLPLAPGNLQVAPDLLTVTPDGDCANDRYTPQYDSPLIDAGDPAVRDPDGTRSDIGAFGGTGADPAWYADVDGDGTLAVYDCDDNNAAIRPGAAELCDSVDNDCDGLVDGDDPGVDLSSQRQVFADQDGDGYGAGAASLACSVAPGFSASNTDCDDARASVNPAASERCNGFDDDCDGAVDEGDAIDARTLYLDADGDGYGDSAVAVAACGSPAGYASRGGDCDDGVAEVNPGARETCNGRDDDCDGAVDEPGSDGSGIWFVDDDGDGYGSGPALTACAAPPGTVATGGDCDDASGLVHPGATEWCDGVDNNCDGARDVGAADATTWFRDADQDGWGADTATLQACAQPTGYVAEGRDCDDADAAFHPYATETCTGTVDYNCDGAVGDADQDGDGVRACEDCYDQDGAVHPGAVEVCNGKDDDCDTKVDEADAIGTQLWFEDQDGDGYGDGATSVLACEAPARFVASEADCDDQRADIHPGATESCSDTTDRNCDGSVGRVDSDGDGHLACEECDDGDVNVHPGAVEVCDGVDNDCDGDVDDADAAVEAEPWYLDNDGDGYGADASMTVACEQPNGAVGTGGDCDDDDAGRSPGVTEVDGDGVDQDCDGLDGGGDTGRPFDSAEEDDSRPSRCGCASSAPSGVAGWLGLALGLVAVGRRRRG